MFNGEEFTLQKFKAIINSDSDLSRFKAILNTQRDRILHQSQLPLKTCEACGDDELVLEDEEIIQPANLSYLPYSFEGMMESFGVNLQRQSLYQNYHISIDNIS